MSDKAAGSPAADPKSGEDATAGDQASSSKTAAVSPVCTSRPTPGYSPAKYSAGYDTPGMRMSVSAVLAGSGRDTTFYRALQSPRPQKEEKPLTNEQLVRALTSVPVSEEKQPASSTEEAFGTALAAVAASVNPSKDTAAAIGNLAANISTILQSSGEDKQPRRPSALASTSALTQMIDQAFRLNARNDTVTVQGHTYDSSPFKLKGKASEEDTREESKKPQKIVRSDKAWEKLSGLPERRLGSYLYSPGLLLPIDASQLNSLVEVVIPARHLTYDNPQVERKAVWGTDIYTDDSDIVPMIVHSGKYPMAFVEPDIDPRDPFFAALGAELDGDLKDQRPAKHAIPDHDVKVTLRVMPTLKRYAGTIRHYIASRAWGGDHDGASYWVESVEKIERGEAQPKGRQGIKANMMRYAYERYLTVGPPPAVKRRYMREDDEEEPSLVSVMRRSKSKPKKKVKVVSPPPAPSPSPSRRRVRRAAAKGKTRSRYQ